MKNATQRRLSNDVFSSQYRCPVRNIYRACVYMDGIIDVPSDMMHILINAQDRSELDHLRRTCTPTARYDSAVSAVPSSTLS